MKYSWRSIIVSLLCLVMIPSVVLTSCNSGNSSSTDISGDTTQSTESSDAPESSEGTEGSENNEENKKQIPIYQGMTITDWNSSTLKLSATNYRSGVMLLSSNNGNNGNNGNSGNHYGHHKGDCTDNKSDLDTNNPYPDHDEKIEDEIRDSLDVIGSTKEIYYTTPNQDIYINIHISNPDRYEILSFTLNGEKYSSYMFEQGSTLETLILKVNVGNDSGIVEYTIDQIKYVDETEIKDVKIDGEKTVKAGIKIENQISAIVSNVEIGTNSISFATKITDKDALIAYSNGAIKAVLYDGEQLVDTKDIAIGDNNIVFDLLTTNSVYQYAIVAFYDDLSGNGVETHILAKNAFSTNAVVLFDNIAVDKTNITFGFKWDEGVANKTLTSLKLYQGETLVKNLAVGATSVNDLLSGESYILIAGYQDLGKSESITLEFTTLMKEEYIVSITNPTNTQTSVGFEISETDTDNVGSVTNIELYNGDQLVKEAENLDVRSFDGLLSNTTYTVKITYTYNLNNGAGDQTEYKTLDIKTEAKAVPVVEIANPTKTQGSIGFTVNETDTDNVGAITKVELIYANGTVVAESVDVREFTGLLSNTTYTLKVSYTYDLNDGVGARTIIQESSITTLAKSAPTIAISNASCDKNSMYLEISRNDSDNTITEVEVDLLIDGVVVKNTKLNESYTIADLLYDTKYFVRVTVYYDLNDGNGVYSKSVSTTVTTPYYVDEQGVSYKTYMDGTAEVVGFTAGITEIIIPESIGAYSVTNIADSIFANSSITSIHIPSSVQKIGAYAFNNCGALVSVELNEGLEEIGMYAFERCNDIQKLVVPLSVSKIGYRALFPYDCSIHYHYDAISNIYIKATSKPSGWDDNFMCNACQNAFWGFDKFVEQDGILFALNKNKTAEAVCITEAFATLVIPNTVDDCNVIGIAPRAFIGYKGDIAFPDNLEYIDFEAFKNITITALELPKSLRYIRKNAFYNAGISVINISSSYICISDGAFESWHMPDHANVALQLYISLNATGCIEGNAFASCYNLRFVNIPSGMTIYDNAFSYCDNLQICCLADRRPTSWGDEWEDGAPVYWSSYVDKQGVVYKLNSNIKIENQPTMTVLDYLNADIDSIYIPDEILGRVVYMIGEEAFWDTNISKIYIPKSIQIIAERAIDSNTDILYQIGSIFSDPYYGSYDIQHGCIYTFNWEGARLHKNLFDAYQYELLEDYYDEQSATYFDFYVKEVAFEYEEIVIPSYIGEYPVTRIGDEVFLNCTEITRVVIPDSVTSIGERAFYGCSNLIDLVIPDSVTSFYSSAFFGCSKLIEEENGVYYIGNWCIGVADGVKEVVIKDGITRIKNDAFRSTSVTSVTIRNSVTYIGETAFYDCSNLTSIIIPNSINTIADNMFMWCTSLTSVVIPDSVTSTGSYVFWGCDSMERIYYSGTAEEWAEILIGSYNSSLINATRYYYIEKEGDLPADNDNYWHYVDGIPTPW